MNRSELSDILKEHGLNVAEDTAIAAVKSIFKALPDIALKTENKVDDLFIPVVSIIEPKIIEMLDKIDGVEG